METKEGTKEGQERDDLELKARVLETAIITCMINGSLRPGEEDMWRRRADVLERKFTTEYGRHYSYFIKRNFN